MDNPYNQVPYHGTPFPQAHINRSAIMAKLVGIAPPPLATARVLELGCGEGAHLIPMAMAYPEAQFVGVDLAEMPIAKAEALAEQVGLNNVKFRQADVAQLTGQPGECDYLIAHGLYSWVAEPVQQKILELISHLLAPNGIAYVSYNVYPGWHIRDMTRNIVRLHTAGLTDPGEVRLRALSLLNTIYQLQDESELYRSTVKAEMERLAAKDANQCFHDDFAEVNQPCYFADFMKRASANGLQFLSEAELTSLQNLGFPSDTEELFGRVLSPLEREQQFDVLTLRAFRRTLLCRDDLVLSPQITTERFEGLYFGCFMTSETREADRVSSEAAHFESANGARVVVNQPAMKAVLWRLIDAWPGRVSWEDLAETARQSEPEAAVEELHAMMREILLRLFSAGTAEIQMEAYPYAVSVSERPVVSPLARIQAKAGGRLTSLRHYPVEMEDDPGRTLVQLADGTRTVEQLVVESGSSTEDVNRLLARLLSQSLLVA